MADVGWAKATNLVYLPTAVPAGGAHQEHTQYVIKNAALGKIVVLKGVQAVKDYLEARRAAADKSMARMGESLQDCLISPLPALCAGVQRFQHNQKAQAHAEHHNPM